MIEPLIVEHGLYDRAGLLKALGISPSTLSRWESLGLPSIRCGNRNPLYHGGRTIAFLYDLSAKDIDHRRQPKLKGAARVARGRKGKDGLVEAESR